MNFKNRRSGSRSAASRWRSICCCTWRATCCCCAASSRPSERRRCSSTDWTRRSTSAARISPSTRCSSRRTSLSRSPSICSSTSFLSLIRLYFIYLHHLLRIRTSSSIFLYYSSQNCFSICFLYLFGCYFFPKNWQAKHF